MCITLPYSSKVGQNVQRRMTKCDRHVQTVNALMLMDWKATIRELANDARLVPLTLLNILKKWLGMWKITSRWVPYDLIENQKWLWYDAAHKHLELYECKGEAFLRQIITIDKAWARVYELQLKCQSNKLYHGSPWKVTAWQAATNVKAMLIIAYDWDGVIIKHTVSQRCTVIVEYYCTFLQDNLQAAQRRKRGDFLNNPPIILHDNARTHAAGAVTDLLNRWGWEVLYPPPPLILQI